MKLAIEAMLVTEIPDDARIGVTYPLTITGRVIVNSMSAAMIDVTTLVESDLLPGEIAATGVLIVDSITDA